jgi:hypothetical protein
MVSQYLPIPKSEASRNPELVRKPAVARGRKDG